ncbi:type II secretion system F family protein, partial [Salmonella enterica]|nr:secretion system protein [Salmonella enterica]EGI2257507.1 secretion system protein [Salmonella enterica subsp. enterica serovar Sandiego]EKO1371915.1 type II secretion system F family protein [Salmonella enterica]MGD83704.1 secretion system protein [Salmonella enterica]
GTDFSFSLNSVKQKLNENADILKRFLLGESPWNIKKSKNGFCAVLFLFILQVANQNWLKFDTLLFLVMTLLVEIVILLNMATSRMKKEFEAGFMEVLSTLTASVMAGSSIHQALHRCGETIEGPVGEEFSRINRRLNVGEDPEHVLLDAWRRFRYDEFYYFIMIILMSIQRGGQLKILIGRLSRVLMDNKAMENKKKAMTSEARSSSKIVAAIPLLFFMGMKYLNPENYDFIINERLGNYVLYYVICSEILGLFIIWMLIKRAI